MKHIHKEQLYIHQGLLIDQLFDTSAVFFDIETTGFSPAHAVVYLIGCMRRDEDTVYIDQFFAEAPEDEKDVLAAFLAIAEECRTIISYNGVGFDLPFLKAKCNAYEIDEHFKTFEYLDIFKAVSGIRFLLKLPNYKQKTLESFLELSRDDKFSGGELINVYHDYCKTHSDESEQLLLLHNFEDVIGMMDLLPVFSYIEFLHGQYSIVETKVNTYKNAEGASENELFITLRTDFPVPKRVSYQYRDFYLILNSDTATLRVPIFCGELRFFYSDYKNYYYLPKEDMAIHKSVASFVDKEYRENARASNCYTKKSGEFLPQYDTVMSPIFKKEYKDNVSYFELTKDFCSSDVMLRRYITHVLKSMQSPKDKR